MVADDDTDEATKEVVTRWRYVLEQLVDDPLELHRELDWVAKYRIVDAYRRRHDLPLAHPRVAMLDLAYHDVTRDRGLYYLLERQGRVERVLDDESIEHAMTHAPPDTRAVGARGAGSRPATKGASMSITWSGRPEATAAMAWPLSSPSA